MAKEFFVCELVRAPTPFALAYPTKQAVVWSYKELIGAFDQYGPAIGANSRIDDRDMNRAAGKVFINSEQIERAGMNILRWNIVSEVDNLSRGIRGKNHSLHRAHEIVLRAKVGQESDDRRLQVSSFKFHVQEFQAICSSSCSLKLET